MMETINDVPQQFAGFFPDGRLHFYAALVLRRLSEGHICADLSQTDGDHSALTALPMIGKAGEREPFILHNGRLYLERYFYYETQILKRLQAFARTGKEQFSARWDALLGSAEMIRGIFADGEDLSGLPTQQQVNWQLAAALCGALNNFTIITGGPGTGKTTTVARLLAILYATDPQLRVALAAPTGKAAVRMAESLRNARLNEGQHLAAHFAELQPMTVHRLLGYIPDSPHFRQDRNHPLPYQVVIVDEASMLDAAMFAKLLLAVGNETRLVLLGDKDQLASVEAGSLLGDLCQLEGTVNQFPGGHRDLLSAFGIVVAAPAAAASPLAGQVTELLRSRRFSSQAGIGQLSRAIIGNDQELLDALITSGNEQISIDVHYGTTVFEDFARLFGAYITAADPLSALQAFNCVRILCAVHGGEQGVNRLNRRVEEYLRQQQLLTSGGEFYMNRPVMVTGNNYELELFNGDIGIVRPDAAGVMKVWFEDGLGGVRDLLPAYLPEIVTAYAMTIHKSQGSEYNQVLIVLPGAANERLMTRELLYTAVTRARQRVLIQGSRELILGTAAASVQRSSGIKERFNEEHHADLA